MIVIDPRKTRTALAGGQVRSSSAPARTSPFDQRRGRSYIIDWMETPPGRSEVDQLLRLPEPGWQRRGSSDVLLEHVQRRPAAGSTPPACTKFGSKYTDARFLVNAAGTRLRSREGQLTGDPFVGGEPDSTTIFDFPKKSDRLPHADLEHGVQRASKAHVDTVYLKLRRSGADLGVRISAAARRRNR